VLQTLQEVADRSTEHQGIFLNFILDHLPEIPEGDYAADDRSYEAQIYRQQEALLRTFLECHYHMYNTDEKLAATNMMLDNVIAKISSDMGQEGEAKGRVQGIKDRLSDYQQEVIRNKQVSQLMQRIYTDPEISANPEKITKVIEDLSVMVQRKDMELKEAQDLVDAIMPTRDLLVFAKDLAEGFATELLKICFVGKRESIAEKIQSGIYDKEAYKNPQIKQIKRIINSDGTVEESESIRVIQEDELVEIQKTILESVVAYLTSKVYKYELASWDIKSNILSCPRCTYNAAWLIAQNLVGGQTEWVDVLKQLPYNSDGNVDDQGLPDRGSWYPQNAFLLAFKPLMSEQG
jgi:hypothetical protein